MRAVIAIVALLVGSTAFAQAPPPAGPPKSFFREDGRPTDKVLLQASSACHAHNSPADAKVNCAVIDNQITARAKEADVKSEIAAKAIELAK